MIPDDINIIKAVDYFVNHFIGSAVLETGVVIHMKEDGSALGEDGKIYYTVSQDDEDGNCDILVILMLLLMILQRLYVKLKSQI